MRVTLLTTVLASCAMVGSAAAQGILPEMMYGVYALDDSCAVGSRRLLITPEDILIADPRLDIRVSYPDQRQVTGDEVALAGNFFVSVIYDGAIRRTADGAVMSFNFPDLSFPLLEPILKSVLGNTIPSALRADLHLVTQDNSVVMQLQSDDSNIGARIASVIGTWTFDANQITRTRGDRTSVYLRCFEGRTAGQHHGILVSDRTGIYGRDGLCEPGGETFVIAKDGWGLTLPFGDPAIGFAFASDGGDLIGELYRAPFAPLAPHENSYIDIEVRDGAPTHRLSFNDTGSDGTGFDDTGSDSTSFDWTRTLSNGDLDPAGRFSKCAEVGEATFDEVVEKITLF